MGATDHDLEDRRRRLRYRAWRRGTREMDLLLGRFADAKTPHFDAVALGRLERLCDEPDTDLLAWMTGAAGIPDHVDRDLVLEVVRFQGGAANE